MTNETNKTLLRDRKRWRIKQIDELDEQKCTQKIGILPGPTKKWQIKRIDKLDEFYCNFKFATVSCNWVGMLHLCDDIWNVCKRM